MMIVALAAQGASFLHVRGNLTALDGDSQFFEAQRLVQSRRICCFPGTPAADWPWRKSILRAAAFKLFPAPFQ
jgi:hypothetical protein